MSKSYTIFGVLVVVLLLVGFLGGYFGSSSGHKDSVREEYSLQKFGLVFEYKTEPDGYVVDDLTSFIDNQVEGAEALGVYRVINTREKKELEESEGGREGPPTINLMIFDNPQNLSASLWVDSFPQYSNMNMVIGNVDRDAVVGGANAVSYRADGLYLSDNVVIASGGYIYFFSGSFLEEGSTIHNDFKNLIKSVRFIPETETGSKIDIRFVCENALSYMTFASGEEAEIFVSDCVEGKHPEVVEKYISDMNLDGASI